MDVQAPLGSTPSAFSGKTRLRPPPPLRRLFGPPESGRGTRAVFELPSVHDSTCFGVRRGLEWARGELRDARARELGRGFGDWGVLGRGFGDSSRKMPARVWNVSAGNKRGKPS